MNWVVEGVHRESSFSPFDFSIFGNCPHKALRSGEITYFKGCSVLPKTPYAGIISEPTLTMTRKTVSHRTATYVECAHAQKANHVIPLTASLTPLYLGVFPTRETDTITGQDCTADWSGTATLVPP